MLWVGGVIIDKDDAEDMYICRWKSNAINEWTRD
jgi:hypothetical protein